MSAVPLGALLFYLRRRRPPPPVRPRPSGLSLLCAAALFVNRDLARVRPSASAGKRRHGRS